MNKKYYLADSVQMNKRRAYAEKFYNTILDPDEIPYIVTDEACLYDFFAGHEFKLIHQVKQKYGIEMNREHFKIPFGSYLICWNKTKNKLDQNQYNELLAKMGLELEQKFNWSNIIEAGL